MRIVFIALLMCIGSIVSKAQLFEQAYLLETKNDILTKMKAKTGWIPMDNERLKKEDILYYRHNTGVLAITYSFHHNECLAYTVISPVTKDADRFLVKKFGQPVDGKWIDPVPIRYNNNGNIMIYHAVWSIEISEHMGKPVILYLCGAIPFEF